jgi:hypothetical protein
VTSESPGNRGWLAQFCARRPFAMHLSYVRLYPFKPKPAAHRQARTTGLTIQFLRATLKSRLSTRTSQSRTRRGAAKMLRLFSIIKLEAG